MPNKVPYMDHLSETLPFVGALAALLVYGGGPLLWPGVAAAAVAAALSLLGRRATAAAVGAAAASCSFIAQGLTAFCPYCTLAASLFAVGVAACSRRFVREKPVTVLVLFSVLAFSAVFLAKETVRPPASPAPETGVVQLSGDTTDLGGVLGPSTTSKEEILSVGGRSDTAGKHLVYFSPHCNYCTKVLREMVGADPNGQKWLPVVVPQGAYEEGLRELRSLGYRGNMGTAARSPAGGVPCLRTPDGSAYLGAGTIIRVLQKEGLLPGAF